MGFKPMTDFLHWVNNGEGSFDSRKKLAITAKAF